LLIIVTLLVDRRSRSIVTRRWTRTIWCVVSRTL